MATTARTAPSGSRFPTLTTIARALVAARWLLFAWTVGLVVIADNRRATSIRVDDPSGPDTALRHPVVAWVGLCALLAVCVWATVRIRRVGDGRDPIGAGLAAADVVLALGLSVADGWIFDPGHVFETSQSLATQYPIVAVASVALVAGPLVASALGSLVGPAEWWAVRLNDFDELDLRHWSSLVATSFFFAVTGALLGWLAGLLREVERTIADQRSRDEVASVLHDTVMQTLALVDRRARETDPDLARAARVADRDLRRYLAIGREEGGDLASSINDGIDRVRRVHDPDAEVPVTVNVLADGLANSDARVRIVSDAVVEAVANALEHARPGSVVVFVEHRDDGAIEASVRDDGVGFDPRAAGDGEFGGLVTSIVRRVDGAGGRVEVRSEVGRGTDVRLWL